MEQMYRTQDGVNAREVTYDTGRGGDPVEIVHISDIHFNKLSIRDMIEHNPSTISTFDARGMCAYGRSVLNLRPCLAYAANADQLVVTGDTLDYLTDGALAMLDTYIWQPFPEALVSLGNHDSMRTMGLPGTVEDPTAREERYALLQARWKHDVYYTARVLKDKVTVIQLDDGPGHFWDNQLAPLARDIAEARNAGRIVLLFMHDPLCSRNPAEHPLKGFGASCAHDAVELYEGGVGYRADGATAAVYDLITHNADVVRGVFCGHRHSSMRSEILAQTIDGKQAIIPQYVVNGVYSKPFAIRITVK
jgi:3',5'-cyclic AMP phosphodiesterase CpdA